MNLTCAACGTSGMQPFYEVTGIPSQTCVLLEDRQQALRYPIGDLTLSFCSSCGFIQNARFDQAFVDYSQPTEESQAFSPKFMAYAAELADNLVRAHELEGKSVLEVGCGKGEFLLELGKRGIGHGLGIDPGFLPDRPGSLVGEIEFVRDWYNSSSTELTADLVLSRHLIEHIPNASEFLGWLASSTSRTPGATLFTEVPDVLRVLKEGAFWDVYYEHCSYFTRGSLARALSAVGLEVREVRLGFEEQYLLATAGPGEGGWPEGLDNPEEVEAAVTLFSERAQDQIAEWRRILEEQIGAGERVAIWGGGSKTVAFLSTLGVAGVMVVDINPFKQGKWLPSLGVEVQSPEVLREASPTLVIPMNSAYVPEISRELERMGLAPLLLTV